jgi:hypothetical protein
MGKERLDIVKKLLRGKEDDLKEAVENIQRARETLEILASEGVDTCHENEAFYLTRLLLEYSKEHVGAYPFKEMKEFAKSKNVPYSEVREILRYTGFIVD